MIFFMDKKSYSHVIDYIINTGEASPLKIIDNKKILIKAKATYIFYIKSSSA